MADDVNSYGYGVSLFFVRGNGIMIPVLRVTQIVNQGCQRPLPAAIEQPAAENEGETDGKISRSKSSS